MTTRFVRKTQGPAVIKAASSNTISDAYRDSITIAYQYIGSTIASTAFDFFGRTFDTPIMAGPIGMHGKGPEAGDLGYARAVKEAGSIYWSHYHDPEAWSRILAEGLPAIRVIKPLADIEKFINEVMYDTEHGALGYAMDIDHGMDAYGEMDRQAEAFAAKSAEDIRRISEASPLPFFLKGILSVHDAVMAKEAGVSGIVVSGHNNRFPCAVPPLMILPEIRKAVGDEMMILIDGGMNSGYDVFKALALGADGVLNARNLCAAYMKDGEEGLTYRILEMTAELKGAMGNTGSRDLAHINRGSVYINGTVIQR